MFEKKNLLILVLIGILLFVVSSTVLADEENKIFLISLKIQRVLNDLVNNLRISFFRQNDAYQEKYYYLLQEISQLKHSLKKIEEKNKALEELKNLIPLEVYKKDPQGIFYSELKEGINEGDIVVDRNLALIGFVWQKNKNYLIIKTLLYPEIVFNLSDAENNFLGSGKTLPNGFVVINNIRSPKVKKNMLVFTWGNDGIFRPNFLVGSISELEKTDNEFFKIIVKLEGLFDENRFYVFK